jgi:hypothetical protein
MHQHLQAVPHLSLSSRLNKRLSSPPTLLSRSVAATPASPHPNPQIQHKRNEALERDLDPEFRRLLLELRNLRSLQTLLLFHVLPARVHAAALASHRTTLAGEALDDLVAADVGRADAVDRPDGIIHGVGRLLVLRSVKDYFNRRRVLRASASAVLPTGTPEVDPRTHCLKKTPGAAPALPVWDAMALGPSITPASW